MNQRQNSQAFTALAVVLTIAMFVVTWKLILPSYSTGKAQLAKLEQEINQANERKESLDTARASLDSLSSTYQAITVAVSNDADEANLISELESIALKNGIVLPSINIGTEAIQASVDSAIASVDQPSAGQAVSISLNVNGTFDQLASFVDSLEKSVKFMNITSMTYAKGEADKIDLNLGISAFSRAATVQAVAGSEEPNE